MAEIISFPKHQAQDHKSRLIYEFGKKLRELEMQKLSLLHYIEEVEEHGMEVLHQYKTEGAFQDELESNIKKCRLDIIIADYFGFKT